MDINKIFSREALNKLRSPEKLDTLLPITTPINWMALIAIGILFIFSSFVVYIWSIYCKSRWNGNDYGFCRCCKCFAYF